MLLDLHICNIAFILLLIKHVRVFKVNFLTLRGLPCWENYHMQKWHLQLLSSPQILLTVTWEAGFPDVTVSEGNKSFCFTWPTQCVLFQWTLLCQECSITSVLYPTAFRITKYNTIKKICSGWSTVQWFNSCYIESQHLKSVKEWLIISEPRISFPRKKPNTALL